MNRARRYLPIHLVADARPGVFERRQGSCVKLATCEFRWSRRYGVQQARCPDRCLRFVRVAARAAADSGGGRVVMGGGA